jgi:putative nucleotidyltransferase with HDIG domain
VFEILLIARFMVQVIEAAVCVTGAGRHYIVRNDIIGLDSGLLFVVGVAMIGVMAKVASRAYWTFGHAKCCDPSQLNGVVRKVSAHDPATTVHSLRVARIVRAIAREMGIQPQHARLMTAAALLHDIGKMEIPRSILGKSGPLTEEEWTLMASHADRGARILRTRRICPRVVEIVRHHHERWDGGGYPAGLKGQEIPLGSSLLAVADSLDAMISDRPYRQAMSLEQAILELRRGMGKQWDPQVVDALLRIGLPVALSHRSERRTCAPLTVEEVSNPATALMKAGRKRLTSSSTAHP